MICPTAKASWKQKFNAQFFCMRSSLRPSVASGTLTPNSNTGKVPRSLAETRWNGTKTGEDTLGCRPVWTDRNPSNKSWKVLKSNPFIKAVAEVRRGHGKGRWWQEMSTSFTLFSSAFLPTSLTVWQVKSWKSKRIQRLCLQSIRKQATGHTWTVSSPLADSKFEFFA